MKHLGILFKWGYGSLISDKEWLSGRPKYSSTSVNAGTTQGRTVRKTTVLEWCKNMKWFSLPGAGGCLAVSLSWASYHTSFERGESQSSADKFFLNFFLIIAIFKHIFELLWGLPNGIHILISHSVTSCRISGYHTPISRGYLGLSYEPNCLIIPGLVRLKYLKSTL